MDNRPRPYTLESDQVLALVCLMRRAATELRRPELGVRIDRLDLADDLTYCWEHLLGTGDAESGWVLDTLAAGGLPAAPLEDTFPADVDDLPWCDDCARPATDQCVAASDLLDESPEIPYFDPEPIRSFTGRDRF